MDEIETKTDEVIEKPKKEESEDIPKWAKKLQKSVSELQAKMNEKTETGEVVKVPVPPTPTPQTKETEVEEPTITEVEKTETKKEKKSFLKWLM